VEREVAAYGAPCARFLLLPVPLTPLAGRLFPPQAWCHLPKPGANFGEL